MITDTTYLEFAAQGINAALLFAGVVAILWSSTDGRGKS